MGLPSEAHMKFIILDTPAMQYSQFGNIVGCEFVAEKHIGGELMIGKVYIPHDTGYLPVKISILKINLREA